jgi:hypothetical protein
MSRPTGFVEVYVGTVEGRKIELATDLVARTQTAKEVAGLKRLYGMVGVELMYAIDLGGGGPAAAVAPLRPAAARRRLTLLRICGGMPGWSFRATLTSPQASGERTRCPMHRRFAICTAERARLGQPPGGESAMNASLTVGQRRRRLVDAALWSLIISVGMLYLVAPAAERLVPSGWTLVLAVYFYVPVISTAMMVTYSYFGYGIERYDVLKPQAWAAMFHRHDLLHRHLRRPRGPLAQHAVDHLPPLRAVPA